jgi:CRP-like cAMP-binding protein
MNVIARNLEKHAFLSELSAEMIAKIEPFATSKFVNAGDYVFRQGETANFLYLIQSGSIDIELFSAVGGPVVVQKLSAGQALGWSWMIPPYRWRFDARATEPSELIEINGSSLRSLMRRDHELGFTLFERIVRMLGERIESERLQLISVYGARS